MLKDQDLVRAVEKFKDRPIYLKLINQLWPHIKEFDFVKEKELRIPKPQYVEFFPGVYMEEGKSVRMIPVKRDYSHKVIRKVLNQFGLTVPNCFYIEGELVIKAPKGTKKRRHN